MQDIPTGQHTVSWPYLEHTALNNFVLILRPHIGIHAVLHIFVLFLEQTLNLCLGVIPWWAVPCIGVPTLILAPISQAVPLAPDDMTSHPILYRICLYAIFFKGKISHWHSPDHAFLSESSCVTQERFIKSTQSFVTITHSGRCIACLL